MRRRAREPLWNGAGEGAVNRAMFGDTITLYNHWREGGRGGTDRWQRTVMRGVQIRQRAELALSQDGRLLLVKTVSITIPEGVDAGGRRYLTPPAFAADDGREMGWTLDASRNLDVIVLGECVAEPGDGYPLQRLQKEHGYASVKAVSVNTPRGRLRHWRVTAV